jgi:hypothetical protein
LHMYRLRAVETGLSFVRATNSGVSAWIDPYGRIKKSLPLFEPGVIVDNVPLLKKSTLYGVMGDAFPGLCLLMVVAFYIAAVVPIRQFIRLRRYKELLFTAVILTVIVASNTYFMGPWFLTDESASTKNLLVSLFAFLFLIAMLVKTKRSRSILIPCSIIVILCSLGLALVESYYFLLGTLFGLLIYLLALRLKNPDNPV